MRTKVDYRQIYIDNHGAIPRGYHIHHKDGNCHNNNPENLEALHPLVHAQRHEDMGEYAEAGMIRGLFNRNQGIAKYLQKQFYGRREYDLNGPVVKPSISKERDIKILKDNDFVKPDDWGEKRYRSTIYKDYSMDFYDNDYSYVVDAIHRLSDRQRNVILMSFGFLGSEMTLNEIADEFGMNEKTVRRDKVKALEIIKKEISFKFS